VINFTEKEIIMIEPFDIGAPVNHGGCHIGLYQPMLNQFLLTVNNIQHARDIALIASGRYPLFLVNLLTASNYCENLIDNLCCENWALPSEQLVPTQMENYANFVVNADHLLPVVGLHNPALADEKHYLQVCWHYVKLLDQVTDRNIFGWRINKFMLDIFDLQDRQYNDVCACVQNLKKQIIAELYLCKDINLVKISIENILDKAKNDLVF
jgi:hypothetical protein